MNQKPSRRPLKPMLLPSYAGVFDPGADTSVIYEVSLHAMLRQMRDATAMKDREPPEIITNETIQNELRMVNPDMSTHDMLGPDTSKTLHYSLTVPVVSKFAELFGLEEKNKLHPGLKAAFYGAAANALFLEDKPDNPERTAFLRQAGLNDQEIAVLKDLPKDFGGKLYAVDARKKREGAAMTSPISVKAQHRRGVDR